MMLAKGMYVDNHSLRNGKRACSCCVDKRLTPQDTRQIQRAREKRSWKNAV